MGRVIALANQKGGVGKTTSAINIAASLSVLGYEVLVLDADPQANATSGLGLTADAQTPGTYEGMMNTNDLTALVHTTPYEGLYVMPARIDLVGVEVELAQAEAREHRLRHLMKTLSPQYDFILIDCAPSLGLLTVNALVASQSVIIPVQCEYFAMEGLGKLLSTIQRIQAGLNPDLMIEGLLLTMYDKRLRLSNQVVDEINKHFSGMVFETIIPRNTKLSEAPSFGKPALFYDAESVGAVRYLTLTELLLKKHKLSVPKSNAHDGR